MIVGVPRESFPGERRVALVPAVLPNLAKAGIEVVVEAGAGAEAGYPDAEYAAKGAKILPAARRSLPRRRHHCASALLTAPTTKPAKPTFLFSIATKFSWDFLRPLGSLETHSRTSPPRGVTSFSVELMPRTTRAQSMDALSSMATISGYKAVLIAADTLPRLFPMLTTAAGTITPARVLILGCGSPACKRSPRRAVSAPSFPHTTCAPR